MTVEEAKSKWCPMVRGSLGEHDNNSANRIIKSGNDNEAVLPAWSSCVADQCMMWRWGPESFINGMWVKNHDGCCGLAGKP